jgi:sulfatase modifying factor 1
MKSNLSLAILLAWAISASAINIDTVPVGNPGNAPDTRYVDSQHAGGVGAVAYSFNVGTTEVTNAQYVAFLNAVAASDPYGLYNSVNMGSTTVGVVRNGSPGSYVYAVKPPALDGAYTYDDKPVIDVNSGDAMRFANWLHNGQPTGAVGAATTEDGAYTLNGTIGLALATITRNAGARWWLPNESEWYKAAYYNQGTGNYYDYPTDNNSVPNNNLPSSDTGNSANFTDNGLTTGNGSYPMTDAGAYTHSASAYGTYDQGGNVREWNETVFNTSDRGLRGGSWGNSASRMRASFWESFAANGRGNIIGFRVASLAVPEPSSALLALSIFAPLAAYRRRRG